MSDDWTVKEVLEPASGKVHRLYSYKGKPCKRVVLDSPIARQLAGYVLIEKDLWSASVWLAEIKKLRGPDEQLPKGSSYQSGDREKYDLVKGLFVASLTFYGKAFSQCEGRRIKLDKKQLASEYHEAHDDAISFRNNFAAHSGAKLLERAEIALALPPKGKREIVPRVFREMTQPDYVMEREGGISLSSLIAHARSLALRKISELPDKILAEEILPKGYSYWSKQ